MSSLRNALPQREHRERAQPGHREKWGLLEKHKASYPSHHSSIKPLTSEINRITPSAQETTTPKRLNSSVSMKKPPPAIPMNSPSG